MRRCHAPPSKLGAPVEAVDVRGHRELVLVEERADLVHAPDVVLSFLALGIGVERGVVAAFGRLHLAHRPCGGLLAYAGEERIARDRPGVGVDAQQPRVVVEHLLEVRDGPLRIDAVAREAAAHLVVDPAFGHARERERRHLQRALAERRVRLRGVAAQEEIDRLRMGELGRAVEAAVFGIERLGELLVGEVERRAGHLHDAVLRMGLRARERGGELLLLLADLPGVRVVVLAHAPEEIGKGWHAVALRLREVRAAEERHLVGREEHRERPAAAPLREHRLRGLVDLVDVGTLLAIHLHVHEEVVHHLRDGGVLERLVRHHVAPVAGGIAHREEDGLAGALRLRERFLAPGIPVDGIVRVLAQIGARFLG